MHTPVAGCDMSEEPLPQEGERAIGGAVVVVKMEVERRGGSLEEQEVIQWWWMGWVLWWGGVWRGVRSDGEGKRI
jgi:hypothetical protein